MPRTKSLQHYPDRYQEIIRECGLEGKRIDVPMDSPQQAASLRGHWYAFIGSLKAHVGAFQRDAASKGRMLSGGEVDLQQLAGLASTVMVQIVDRDGAILLTFQSREHSWQAKALAGATVTQGEAAPSAPGTIDATAQRLMALQSKQSLRSFACPMCGEMMEPGALTHKPCGHEGDA